jgi:hypothetical protein
VAVIARGTGWTEDYIRWQLPLSRGRAYVHALRLMEGESMLWPDRRLSETGRWWESVRNRKAQPKKDSLRGGKTDVSCEEP